MRAKVHLIRPKNIRKAKLLAPILPKQYADRAATAEFPEELRLIGSHVAATPDGKLALVKNSKAGCTSAVSALYYYTSGQNAPKEVHKNLGKLLGSKGQIADALKILTKPECFSFTFVRHPEKRFLSGFQNFVLDANNSSAPRFWKYFSTFGASAEQSDERKCDLFLDYIERCFSEAKAYTDPHFRTQTINIAFDVIDYSLIGRLESYRNDMRKVFEGAGVWNDGLNAVLDDVRNPSLKQKYVLTASQRKRVANLYTEDFDNFNYWQTRG